MPIIVGITIFMGGIPTIKLMGGANNIAIPTLVAWIPHLIFIPNSSTPELPTAVAGLPTAGHTRGDTPGEIKDQNRPAETKQCDYEIMYD